MIPPLSLPDERFEEILREIDEGGYAE